MGALRLKITSRRRLASNRFRSSVALVFAAALFLTIASFFSLRKSQEAISYKGISLKKWLESVYAGNPSASVAIQNIGTNCIPILLQMIANEHPKPIEIILEKMAEKQIRVPWFEPDAENQALAYCGFRALGRNAECAIPGLASLVNNPKTSEMACFSLVAIGPRGISTILALTNSSQEMELNVLKSLADAMSDQPAVVKAIAEHVRDKYYMSRFVAAQSLGHLRACPSIALPALTNAMLDTNRAVRFIAIQAVGNFGAVAFGQAPFVARLTNDSDLLIRQAAMTTFNEITTARFSNYK